MLGIYLFQSNICTVRIKAFSHNVQQHSFSSTLQENKEEYKKLELEFRKLDLLLQVCYYAKVLNLLICNMEEDG
jgi:hypothetical protein